VRIIAGKYRRRKLLSAPGQGTRPITDLLKEVLFQRLGDEVLDLRIVDLFAGTGTIGLEALSRGARSVVFIEKDRRVHELLKKNVEKIGVSDECLCWQADVLRSSFKPRNVETLVPFDLAFCDPPFAMIGDLASGSRFFRALQRLARADVTTSGARLVLRTPKRASFECPDTWEPEDTWTVQQMDIHLYRKEDLTT